MAYTYKYPRPAVTADCVVITREAEPKVLLIQRGNEPFKSCWAFPGGFMEMDETAEQCAIRELEEETGLKVSELQQIGAYAKVDRDPRGRTVTVAYLVRIDAPVAVMGQDDAAKAEWFPLTALPPLAFDHEEIVRDAALLVKNGFRPMRRHRQQLSEAESIAILKKKTSGTLALLGDEGYPYAVPLSYVYTDGKLYFHSALEGHKVDAIRRCDKASFCIIEQDNVQPEKFTTFYRSVIVFGRIHIIDDEHEKMITARMLGSRYNPNDEESLNKEIEKGLSRMLMIRFDIEHLTGKEAIEYVNQHKL